MTDVALSPARSSVLGNPWLVAAVVVVPTFMEVLDTTIAVVALALHRWWPVGYGR